MLLLPLALTVAWSPGAAVVRSGAASRPTIQMKVSTPSLPSLPAPPSELEGFSFPRVEISGMSFEDATKLLNVDVGVVGTIGVAGVIGIVALTILSILSEPPKPERWLMYTPAMRDAYMYKQKKKSLKYRFVDPLVDPVVDGVTEYVSELKAEQEKKKQEKKAVEVAKQRSAERAAAVKARAAAVKAVRDALPEIPQVALPF